MPEIVVEEAVSTTAQTVETAEAPSLVVSDLLVEDVSIDGMCGVY